MAVGFSTGSCARHRSGSKNTTASTASLRNACFFSFQAAPGGRRRRTAFGARKGAWLGKGKGGYKCPGAPEQALASARPVCAVLKNPRFGPTHPPPTDRKTREQDPPTHPLAGETKFLITCVR